MVDIVHLKAGRNLDLDNDTLAYIITGKATISEQKNGKTTETNSIINGDLIRSNSARVSALNDVHLLVVSQNQ